MKNIEFNNHTPQLVAQLVLGSSLDGNSKDVLSKEFYTALLSSAIIIKALQNIPGNKESINLLSFPLYSLENIFKLIENYNLLIEPIIDDFTAITNYYSQNCELDYFTDETVTQYVTDELLDAINFIKFDLEENPTKYQEILQGLNYVKTKKEELLKSFSIFSKYVQ